MFSSYIDALYASFLALVSAGVAVRVLERRTRSLESLFIELTGHGAAGETPSSVSRDAPDGPRASPVIS